MRQVLDSPTQVYVLYMQIKNQLWYNALLRCAKTSPKLCSKIIKESFKNLQLSEHLEQKRVNPFQICLAARQGTLKDIGPTDLIAQANWDLYVDAIAARIREENLGLSKT